MGSSIQKSQSADVEKSKSHLVTAGDYGLKLEMPVKQKLSALDMNMPRLYGSRWILCFPLLAGIDKAQAFENLRRGLAHTISSIPWISGDVGPEEGSDPESSRVQVVEGSGGVEFRYKDLTGVLPSYIELKKDNFTFSKLTTPLISPLKVIQEPQPVMVAQANFIEDGLLLTVGVHHSVCDGSAFDHILEIWAHNTGVTRDSGAYSQYDPVSNDRTPLCEGLPANIADFPEYVLMPTPPTDPTQMAPPTFQLPPMTVKIFYLSPEHLTDLKIAAEAFSTNDAVSAFFWHHMTKARNPSNDPTEDEKTSAALFAVNIRGRTSPPLPATYLGNALLGGITQRLSIASLKDTQTGLFLWHHMTKARNPSNDPTEDEKTSAALFAVNIRGRTSPPLPATYLGNALLGGITQRLSIASLKDTQTGLCQAAAAFRKGLNAINSPRVNLWKGCCRTRDFSNSPKSRVNWEPFM
ncbi:related to trichothecene 3-O-acetyltransferase [Phialocephala subalpina]|uniref:Related to trichothecene 3-O-acetyltransferase n=1 Tax=Phialocephala subalpina TaxID=576137 RepID=A0A1L7XVG9_9HELO|nr:related to trichothecene 3-O-acetyltransferase [Phialocephala subalpina]